MSHQNKAMTGESNITVELSEDEAHLFVLFRKHQKVFTDLLDSGVLDLKNGTATIGFDHQGKLRQIRIDKIVFKIGVDVVQ